LFGLLAFGLGGVGRPQEALDVVEDGAVWCMACEELPYSIRVAERRFDPNQLGEAVRRWAQKIPESAKKIVIRF
jgi:hypothetical protein